jgi:hypothetical protein
VTEKFPRVGPGYAELTIRRRQCGADREDLQLAERFSGSPIAPGEDDVFDKVLRDGVGKHVRFVEWTGPDDLNAKIIKVLARGRIELFGFSRFPASDLVQAHTGRRLVAVRSGRLARANCANVLSRTPFRCGFNAIAIYRSSFHFPICAKSPADFPVAAAR